MKLIIDIPEEMYKNIKDGMWCGNNITSNAIENGIPIPKNMTNVLDAIKLEIKQEIYNQGNWSFNDGLAFALEIIDKYKAEKEGAEE